MKINLSYKILSAFFLILAIVAGAFALSRYLFTQQFREFIYQEEKAVLSRLVPVLQDLYQKNGDWSDVRDDRKFWDFLMKKAHLPYFPEKFADYPPGGSPPEGLPTDGGRPPNKPPLPHGDKPWPGVLRHVFLMDANFQVISGVSKPNKKESLKAIQVNGQIVGWLGLHKPEHLDPGPADAFMKHHVKQLYVLTGIVIALTCLIAILLSRHLLKPINRLIHGTQELAGRNFKVRLRITTRDELGLLADQFNSMAQTLEDFENLRRQWLTDISHELRTPMTVLRGEIEALHDGMREPTPQNLASLKSEILQLAKLIDDLHMLSMAESDSMNLIKQLVSPRQVLDDTLAGYETRFQQKNIDVVLTLNNTSEIRMLGDAGRLDQVFVNIFENVCNYVASPGTLKITEHFESKYWVLGFHDSGPGVPDDALPHLFDRLYRVDASRNRHQGGSGLGLSICRRIIELHSGSIWARKSPMGGLWIGVKVPLV